MLQIGLPGLLLWHWQPSLPTIIPNSSKRMNIHWHCVHFNITSWGNPEVMSILGIIRSSMVLPQNSQQFLVLSNITTGFSLEVASQCCAPHAHDTEAAPAKNSYRDWGQSTLYIAAQDNSLCWGGRGGGWGAYFPPPQTEHWEQIIPAYCKSFGTFGLKEKKKPAASSLCTLN